MLQMSTQNVILHFSRLSNLQLLVVKDFSVVTAAKARNSVKQTGASVLKQRDFVTASATAVSHVKIRISGVFILLFNL